MRPVALSVVEGRNFILGTFDTSGFQTWWKSLPFPGDVESIEDTTHVYGQYHVCIVKLRNGTNSIYRTHDSGKTWKEVYNTTDTIYSITRIDYGHVIASTSTGWLESTLDSGLTWTKISNFAPGCKTVINVDDDVLFGHDGTNIWRSYDIGRTWSKVLSKNSWVSLAWHVEEYPEDVFYGSWTGYSCSALAGAGKTIYAGFGPYLNISDDLGKTWFTHLQGWTEYWAFEHGDKYGYPIEDWAWGGAKLFSPFYNTRILQLEMTDTSGITSDDHALMARVLNLHTNKVMYAYSGKNYFYENKSTGYAWKIKFELPYADEKHGVLCSYDVLQPGSSEYNKLAMVHSYNIINYVPEHYVYVYRDKLGNYINTTTKQYNLGTLISTTFVPASYDIVYDPVVMYSNDAGWTWNSINCTNVSVYEGDPTQEIISGLGQYVFDEEYWTTATWMGSACHNDGKWIAELNKTIRGLSWDMDIYTIFPSKNKNYNMIFSTKLYKDKEYVVDLLCKKLHTTELNPDILLKKPSMKSMIASGYIKKYFDKTCSIDSKLASRIIKDIDNDIFIQQVNESFFNVIMYQKDTEQKSCEFGIKLVDDHVEEIMTSINRYTPQAPDVRYPRTPYVPFDSRNQEVT